MSERERQREARGRRVTGGAWGAPKVYLKAKGAGLPRRSEGSEPSAESESSPPKRKHRAKPRSCCPRVKRGQQLHRR